MDALYDHLAALWAYPGAGVELRAHVARAQDALDEVDPTLASRLEPLRIFADESSRAELEEHFTRTFDINPVCTLECGWHLFGEDYARGAFLVHMRGLMRGVGVEESGELPDHLTHVLPVLGRLDAEEADVFANDRVRPALEKMLEGFKDAENPYREALAVVLDLVRSRHPEPAETAPAEAEGR